MTDTTTTTTKSQVSRKTAKGSIQKLKSGRPPTFKKPSTLTHHAARKLIREHHVLNKSLTVALANGNEDAAEKYRTSIEALGGLEAYQQASIQGQALERGGDSSAVLMTWLKPYAKGISERKGSERLRLLEVGALSTKNACSKAGLFDIERIDLFSQAEGILKQDFMERPLPPPVNAFATTGSDGRFDVISLSLVLNFVPDAQARWDMLARTCLFLNRSASNVSEELGKVLPALFLVLPASCVLNSRWMNEERLQCMMASLGYVLLERKLTAKLVFYLWQLRDAEVKEEQSWSKVQVNPGAGRNNFAVVMKPGEG